MALSNLARFNRLAMPLGVAATLGLGGIQLVGDPSRAQTIDAVPPIPGSFQSPEGTVMISPGAKGAQMYCFMRTNGNPHQVSWDAAYALMKRQSDKSFTTSPEDASVMIAEAVVQNPAKFPNCGRYLGELFGKAEPKPDSETEAPTNPGIPVNPGPPTNPGPPVNPGPPTNPGPPSKPGAPSKPAAPAKPGPPTKPGPPSKPGAPSKPAAPAKP